MCHVLDSALTQVPRTDRRRLLTLLGAGAAATAVGAGSPAVAAAPAHPGKPSARTRVVLLGTAGGPALTSETRHGVSTAVVYDDRVYLVDLGVGSFHRLQQAGLGPDTGLGSSLTNVRGVFFTHLHSDHTVDWPAMYAVGTMNTVGRDEARPPIRVYGPGSRDTLPRVFPPGRPEPEPINPDDPSPGIAGMTGYVRQAFATDFNDRLRDSNFPDPDTLFDVRDLDLDGIWSVDATGVPPRLDRPIHVWDDGDVTITATLVDHHPTAPAFGYRFDTPDGSVVISGDTCVSPNLIDLADGADCLVHEVIDPEFVDELVASLPAETAGPVREHLLAAHTTIEQVGRDVAEPAGVDTLVLTHLVGSAPDRRWRQSQRGFSGRVVVGKDLLEVPVGAR